MSKVSREILDHAANIHIPENTNIYPALAARIEGITSAGFLRLKPGLLVIWLVLALIIFSGVAYAVGRSLGYIPGLGLVNNETPVRILGQEVQSSQGDINLKVTNLIADASGTELTYHIGGIPIPDGGSNLECAESPVLNLPDGSQMAAAGMQVKNVGGENGSLSFDAKITFPPLPASIKDVSLRAPCNLPPVTLKIIQASGGLVLPVTEVSIPSALQAHSGLYLEHAYAVSDSYILTGYFLDAGENAGLLVMDDAPYSLKVTDAGGQPVTAWVRPELFIKPASANRITWALEIPKNTYMPVTISLPTLQATQTDVFTLPVDVGAHPQTGQSWPINQELRAGNYSLFCDNISAQNQEYLLTAHLPANFSPQDVSVSFALQEQSQASSTERFYKSNGLVGIFEGLRFTGSLPAGLLHFIVQITTSQPAGPWKLTWSSSDK